jgi:predicted dehydrogenase
MDTVRLGVIGLGWFGGVLTESARKADAAEVVAGFARSEDTRRTFEEEHGVRGVSDVEELFGDPEIDGVLVVTPHSTHADLAVRAAEAGKHVFVEKPLALNVADTRRVAEAADRAGVLVQVGHNRRRQPANRRIKAMLDSGELGTVLHLDGMHTAPGGFKPDLPAWRKDPVECPYGGMTALGVHTVDTFNYFVGPAKRVTAFSTTLERFTDLDEATTVLIAYEAGALGSISTTYFAPPNVSLSVFGTDAAVWNEEDGARLYTQPRSDPTRTEQEIETLDTMTDEIAEFVGNVRDGGRPETGVAEAIEVAAVLEAIGRSVETGTSVDVADLR